MSVGGAADVMKRLRKLPPKVIEEALDEVAASQETEVAIRFERGHGPDGVAWAPLRPSTLKRRKSSGPPLTVTGALGGSITRATHNISSQVGTNYETARYHQDGTSRMKARPFIGWSADGQREAVDVLRARIAREVGVQ